MTVNEGDIRAAYRLILGREPESDQVVATFLQRGYSLPELRRVFLNSTEFRNSATGPDDSSKPLNWAPMTIETEGSPAELARMLRRIEAYWRRIGQEEVHWPLLQHGDLKSSDFTKDEQDFYGGGRELIEIFQRTAERCGVSLGDHKVCMELGCGVGRLTVWLSEVFSKILAADISRLRLDLNQRALRRYQSNNVEHHHLVTIESLSRLPDFDAFFSIVVLQHNPPPVILFLLKLIFGKLSPGGIAYFQVPTFIHNYAFLLADYFRETSEAKDMEMHAIPQRLLFEIIEVCGCDLLEIREDPWTDSREIISNSVFVKKKGAAA